MPKAFETWTVVDHQPIEKLADNLWRVSGTMPGGKIQRQMVMARMGDGRVVIHNAVAMREEEMRELEAWGTPSVLFVPNGFHRMDAAIWKQRYPKALVTAPIGARKRVAKVVPVDVTSESAPGDDTVKIIPLDGLPGESVLEVRSGDEVSLVFCDAVLNMPPQGRALGLMLSPTGRLSVPRYMRWLFLKDKKAFAAHLERLAATPGLTRILVGHGTPVTDDPAGKLQAAARQLS
jgi:hypothetical protein